MLYLDDIDNAELVMADLNEHLVTKSYPVMEHDPRPFFAKFEVTAGQDWQAEIRPHHMVR